MKPTPMQRKRLEVSIDNLVEIVDGVRWHRWQYNGRRLVDTPEWRAFYAAWIAIKQREVMK